MKEGCARSSSRPQYLWPPVISALNKKAKAFFCLVDVRLFHQRRNISWGSLVSFAGILQIDSALRVCFMTTNGPQIRLYQVFPDPSDRDEIREIEINIIAVHSLGRDPESAWIAWEDPTDAKGRILFYNLLRNAAAPDSIVFTCYCSTSCWTVTNSQFRPTAAMLVTLGRECAPMQIIW